MLSFSADSRLKFFDTKIREWFARGRIQHFIEQFDIQPMSKIIDLGGRPEHWNLAPFPLKLDIINTSVEVENFRSTGLHDFNFLEGDVTKSLSSLIDSDFIYCNSVFEHLPTSGRDPLAKNILNANKPYWVQIPSIKFPVEPHCREVLWWKQSEHVRRRKIEHWEQVWPFMADQMTNLHAISENDIRQLFPEAVMSKEKFFGFEKSIILYSSR